MLSPDVISIEKFLLTFIGLIVIVSNPVLLDGEPKDPFKLVSPPSLKDKLILFLIAFSDLT